MTAFHIMTIFIDIITIDIIIIGIITIDIIIIGIITGITVTALAQVKHMNEFWHTSK
jgi:hypothetical protein